VRALAVVVLVVAGCKSASSGPYAPPAESARNAIEAQRLTGLAGDLVDEDPAGAEALLREALTADLYHGPAHNNLGVLYLNQGKLYEAAHEFEWARKLMPGHTDPRVNLAIALERAGKIGDAMDAYKAALELESECIPAMQGAAMLAVRSGQNVPSIERWLAEISQRGDTDAWRDWARLQRARRGPTSAVSRP